MTMIVQYKCDGCGKLMSREAFCFTASASDGGEPYIYERTEMHACSEACASKVSIKVYDETREKLRKRLEEQQWGKKL